MSTSLESRPAPLVDATEAARKTLRLLAAKRVAPTPDNYRQIYCEIIGGDIDTALPEDDLSWGPLIKELLKQWETRHVGWTVARKRDSLERVLASPNPQTVRLRLENLVRSWSEAQSDFSPAQIDAALAAHPVPTTGDIITVESMPGHDEAELAISMREWLAQALEAMAAAPYADATLVAESKGLILRVRAAREAREIAPLSADLRYFWLKLERRYGYTGELRTGLLRLLRLLADNVQELLTDDRWIQGQLDVVRRVLSDPDDLQLIETAERSIKEVIFKQGVLKHSLNEAKTTLKDMVSRFIDQIGQLARDTGAYQDKLDHYADKIKQTEDIVSLNAVLDELMLETNKIQSSTTRTREDMIAARSRAEAAEGKVRELEAELAQVSELVREDQLTGILNRRGLDDAFQRELSRAQRKRGPLCVALLDIDNFKRLNDTFGHQAGDHALVHLVNVVKATVRPHDIIARYGGEEFMLLLPDTGLEEAVDVVTRLQRGLTKHFFLHDNNRLLITFSAGVALCREDEERDQLVGRADRALYEAKKAGKNRVFAAL